MSTEKRFVIRVYGLILNSRQEVLIAEEYHYNTFMRKFPGGGLEFGEGPVACLRRELAEELHVELDLEDCTHLHTTDFYAPSAFNPSLQVVGIYYLINAKPELEAQFREEYLLPAENGIEQFRWVKISELKADDITFPTDRQALEKLNELLKK